MANSKHRPFGYYVVKAVRMSGWFLLGLMVLYIWSGYVLSGEFGLDRTMSETTALGLHATWKLDRLLIVVLLVHSGGVIWMALRRWGWIKSGKKPPKA